MDQGQGLAARNRDEQNDQNGADKKEHKILGKCLSFNGQFGDHRTDTDAHAQIDQIAARNIAQGKLGIPVKRGNKIKKQLRRTGTEGDQGDTHNEGGDIFFLGNAGGTGHKKITAFE